MPTDTDHTNPDPTTIEDGDPIEVRYASVYGKNEQILTGTVDHVDPLESRGETASVTVYVRPDDEDVDEATNRVEFDNMSGGWKGYSVETRHNGGWNRISRVLAIKGWSVSPKNGSDDDGEQGSQETAHERPNDETEVATDGGTTGVAEEASGITEAMIPDDDHDGETQTTAIQLTRRYRHGVTVSVEGPTPISAADLERIAEQVTDAVDVSAAPDLADGERVASATVGTVEYLASGDLVDVEVEDA